MSFARAAFLLSAGPLVWAAHFLGIYGYTGLACARALAASVPWVVAGATLAAAAACALVMRIALRERESFEGWLAASLCALALLAIAWEAMTVLLVRPCA
jgi:hypothetical protein